MDKPIACEVCGGHFDAGSDRWQQVPFDQHPELFDVIASMQKGIWYHRCGNGRYGYAHEYRKENENVLQNP